MGLQCVEQTVEQEGSGVLTRTFKTPTYEQFRAYATFVPELADFAVNERSLARLLGELELLWGATGLGTGDLAILFNAAASRPVTASGAAVQWYNLSGSTGLYTSARPAALVGPGGAGAGLPGGPCRWLTYDGVVKICRQLAARASRVDATIGAAQATVTAKEAAEREADAARGPMVRSLTGILRLGDEDQGTNFSRRASSTKLLHGAPHGAPHAHGPHGSALMRALDTHSGRPPSPTTRPSLPIVLQPPAVTDPLAAYDGSSGSSDGGDGSSGGEEEEEWFGTGGMSAWAVHVPKHRQYKQSKRYNDDWVTELPGSRPGTASLTAVQAASTQQYSDPAAGVAWGTGAVGDEGMGWGEDEEGSRGEGASMLSVMAAREPPVLLREILPLPVTCDSAAIRKRLVGVAAMISQGEARGAGSVLREVVRDWEAAVGEKALKDVMRRAKGKGGVVDEAAIAAAGHAEIPAEGAAWVLATAAGAASAEARHGAAVALAAGAVESLQEGVEAGHAYHHVLPLCMGCMQYNAGQYRAAAASFRAAYDAAEVRLRAAADPLALRGAAAALNNLGATAQMLGQRSEAVQHFREAMSLLQRANQPPPLLHKPPPPPPPAPSPGAGAKKKGGAAGSTAAAGTGSTGPAVQGPGSSGAAPVTAPAPVQQPSGAAAVNAAGSSGQNPPQSPSPTPMNPAAGAVPPGTGAAASGAKKPKQAKPVRQPGIDAPALDTVAANLTHALRHSFAVGPLPLSRHSLALRSVQQHSSSVQRPATAGGSTGLIRGGTVSQMSQRPLSASQPLGRHPLLSQLRSAQQLRLSAVAGADMSSTAAGGAALLQLGLRPTALGSTGGKAGVTFAGVTAHGSTMAGSTAVRPATAPAHSGTAGSTGSHSRFGSTMSERTASFLRTAITVAPSDPPAVLPPWAVRATEASMEGKGKGKGKDGGKKDKDKGKGKDKDKKGGKKMKEKGFKIEYPGVGFDMPSYSVANIKLEKAKKGKKGAAKKK